MLSKGFLNHENKKPKLKLQVFFEPEYTENDCKNNARQILFCFS